MKFVIGYEPFWVKKLTRGFQRRGTISRTSPLPALPDTGPVMVWLYVLFPENVLLSDSTLDDAAFTVMLALPSNGTPFILRGVASLVAVPALS
jgi:hypothetical protein